jgi:hypothetical protein
LCQIFRKGATFQQIQFRCQQIAYVREIAEMEHLIPILILISINALARAEHSTAHETLCNWHSRMDWS